MQYGPNLNIQILGICTYVNTPILVILGIFWPQESNFDQISQIFSVTSYLGQKLHHTVKIGQLWKFQIFYSSRPPKPKIGPGMLKRALIILVQSNNDH